MSLGRIAAIVAIVIGLTGVVLGTRALRHRRGAAFALAAGPLAVAIGAVIVTTAQGGVGTGHGVGGGVVAIAVGLVAVALGGLARRRASAR